MDASMIIEKEGMKWTISEAALNAAERKFIAAGKRVWTTATCTAGGKKYYAAAFLEKDTGMVQGKFSTLREAEIFALSFANLQVDKLRHVVIHKIKRPDDWPTDYLFAT